jgi:hypothetical protein
MATITEMKNELIDNILAIDDKNLLVDFSNFVAFSKKEIEPTKLSKYQKLMLEMSEEDVRLGRVYTEDEIDKMDEEWLN